MYRYIELAVVKSVRRLLVLLLISTASPGWAAVTVTLVPETLVLQPSGSGYEAVALLSAEGLSLDDDAELPVTIADSGIGRPLGVSVKKVEPLGGLDGAHHWSVVLAFERLPDVDADTRYLKVDIGKQVSVPIKYTVGVYTPPALAWSVGTPTKEWQPQQKRTTSFTVTVGAIPARSVRISHSTLQRTDKHVHLDASDFKLCETRACDKEITDLGPNKTHTVHLSAPGAMNVTGQFEGGLQLLAEGAAAAQTLPLTIYASNSSWKALGFGLILVGIVIAWVVSVFFKARSARATSLLPASSLRDVVYALSNRIEIARDVTNVEFRKIRHTLSELDQALSDDTITSANYVPRKWPNPFGDVAPKEQEYKTYLDAQAAVIARLSRIGNTGIDYIVGHWERVAGGQGKAAKLLEKLDEASDLTDVAKLDAEVEQAVEAFKQLLVDSKPRRTGHDSPPEVTPSQSASLSTQSLEVSLASISLIVWSLWALLTAITGWGALILTNPGFGTASDLLQCLLWGLGVQIAGQQLQQLTPSSVTSAFNITIPAARK